MALMEDNICIEDQHMIVDLESVTPNGSIIDDRGAACRQAGMGSRIHAGMWSLTSNSALA